MEKDDHNRNNILNEPAVTFGGRRLGKLSVFRSFEEAAEAEALADARQIPQERIKETVELILRVYGVTREELKARRNKLHINIISRS